MERSKDKLQNSDMLGNEGISRSVVKGENNIKPRSSSTNLSDKDLMKKKQNNIKGQKEEVGKTKNELDRNNNLKGSVD